MYKVTMECNSECLDWESGARDVFVTDDPVEAIKRSATHRDKTHFSWVEEVTSQELHTL